MNVLADCIPVAAMHNVSRLLGVIYVDVRMVTLDLALIVMVSIILQRV